MILRYVSHNLRIHTAHNPEDHKLNFHRRENLKSHIKLACWNFALFNYLDFLNPEEESHPIKEKHYPVFLPENLLYKQKDILGPLINTAQINLHH
jgi:hypothetical protein